MILEKKDLGMQSNDKIYLAVYMITHNHELYIEQAIKSILSQKTTFNYKLFIGEDFSTDRTREICYNFKEKNPGKIELICSEENIGAKNNAIITFKTCFKSKAKYIALCEGDDYWTDPLKLQKQVDFLESNPNYSFCYTRFHTLNQQTGETVLDFNEKYFKKQEPFIDFDFEIFQKGWHIGTQTMVFRSACFDISVAEKFTYFRDVHLITELLKSSKGACLNFISAIYRNHEGGIYSSISKFEENRIGYKIYKEIYLSNRTNPFLRKKYIHSLKNYINANIVERHLAKAFWLNLHFLVLDGQVITFLKHNKRIFKHLFNLNSCAK